MRELLLKHHRALFYFGWLTFNLVQAGLTGLLDDEAYYWVYAQYPAWGYFDHPPMIAWLIWAGTTLFPGEFGVRFWIAVLNTATVFIIGQLISSTNHRLFYAICFSLAVAQIGGILAVPDLPLLFFTAVFFLAYRRFAERMDIVAVVSLALAVALMLYSKYHGILIILFTLMSNPKLFLKYQTYLVMALAGLLFLPHIIWQVENGMPSVQYHLFERNAPAYQFSFTLEYFSGQLAFAGPVIGWLLLYAAFRYKSRSAVEKALKYSMVGVYLFFLISSLRGRVEANWTVPAFVALIVLSTNYLSTAPRLEKWVYRLLPVTLLLVLALRVFMALDIPRVEAISKDEFHGNETWVSEVEQRAQGLPVVFMDSYQKPSKYFFYSGKPAMSFNTITYRRNNYNYWPLEDSMLNKKVFIAGWKGPVFPAEFSDSYLKQYGSRIVDNYYSFSKVRLVDAGVTSVKAGVAALQFRAEFPDHYLHAFNTPGMDTASLHLAILRENQPVIFFPAGMSVKELKSGAEFRLRVPVTLGKGAHYARLAISSCMPGYPSVNSTGFSLVVD